MNLPLLSRSTELRRATLLLAAGLLVTGMLACSHEDPLPLQSSPPPISPVLAKGGGTGVEWLAALLPGYTAEYVAQENGWVVLESYPEANLALFYDDLGKAQSPPYVVGIQMIEVNDRGEAAPTVPWNIYSGFYEGEVEDDVYTDQDALHALNLDSIHVMIRGTGVRVAIIDTGLDTDHPNLQSRLDYGSGNKVDAEDQLGHGTWVAGIIAAVAPAATLTPYNIFGAIPETDDYRVAEALGRALADGADIVNLSLRLEGAAEVVELKIQQLKAAGVIVIAAAGNTSGGPPVYPASLAETISFAAVDIHDQIAGFSAVGDVDFAAPGVEILTTSPGDAEHPAGGYAYVTGTSMACAVGSGVFALALDSYNMYPPEDTIPLAEDDAAEVTPAGAVIHGRISTGWIYPRRVISPPFIPPDWPW